MTLTLTIPRPDDHLSVSLERGSTLFVLGANGTGKSSLMQRLYAAHAPISRTLSAHRQNSFSSGLSTLTSQNKRSVEQAMQQWDVNPQSRSRDDYSDSRSAVAIANLIETQNAQNREIAGAARAKDYDRASRLADQHEDPLEVLTRILHHAGLPITISARADEELIATKQGQSPYSIAELSDGERNVFLIASDVLTAPEGTLILIDEPERHLHRSIISPLLSELFAARPDCTYVLSTHDPTLALDNATAQVLLVRGCQHDGQAVKHWDVDLMEASTRDALDDDLMRSILGARRNVLFVEGERDSLDNALYSVLLPDVSVIPRGSCKEVEHAVRGIRGADELHWLNAFGLIDSDGREAGELADLQREGIFSINAHSVESLYYDPSVQKEAARRIAEVVGTNLEDDLQSANSAALSAFRDAKASLAERAAGQRIRSKVMGQLPNRKVSELPERIKFSITVGDIIAEEQQHIDEAIAREDAAVLIRRYPVRKTGAPSKIAEALRFPDRRTYESSVLKLLQEDADMRSYVRGLLGGLWEAIQESPPGV